MRKVVWGVLSTARIGTQQVIPAMQQGEWCEVRAIASRNEPAARQAAQALGLPVAHGSYEALLADPAIEAIYNPLPNHMHVEWTLKAAAAGKHVLCEKPVALSAEEAARLRATAPEVLVAEAFMVRFHPQWQRARELVRQGRIGTLRAVQVFFSYFNEDASNIRNQPAAGGGALYDVGCYAVVAGRWFFEGEPRRAVALVDRDPRFGTDRTTSALVDFGGGRHLDFTVSTQCARTQRVQLVGASGRIEIQIPFNAPAGGATRLFVDDASSLDGAGIVTETVAPCNQYTLQGDAFSRAVRGEATFPFDVEDAISNMQLIDALFRSERSGRWEELGA
ncbi:MAG TPA: Gfo/Idh/MocA family oxidoreductase [Anaeromyxobacteraceae bacterium]